MKVFVSHGHNEVAKLSVKDFIGGRLGQTPVILGEQPGRHGLTIIEALERFSVGCEFAVVLLTGDDLTRDGGRRARQNVVHEIGFLQGRLGRAKVVLVVERGVEIPSNLSGLFYLEYAAHIREVFSDLEVVIEKRDASASAKTFDLQPIGEFAKEMGSVDQSWVQSISAELRPYGRLRPRQFFSVILPILRQHAEGYARQAAQFKAQAEERTPPTDMKGKESKDETAGLGAMIDFAGAMLIGPSQRVAQRCDSAVTMIEATAYDPSDEEQTKAVIMEMFSLE